MEPSFWRNQFLQRLSARPLQLTCFEVPPLRRLDPTHCRSDARQRHIEIVFSSREQASPCRKTDSTEANLTSRMRVWLSKLLSAEHCQLQFLPNPVPCSTKSALSSHPYCGR